MIDGNEDFDVCLVGLARNPPLWAALLGLNKLARLKEAIAQKSPALANKWRPHTSTDFCRSPKSLAVSFLCILLIPATSHQWFGWWRVALKEDCENRFSKFSKSYRAKCMAKIMDDFILVLIYFVFVYICNIHIQIPNELKGCKWFGIIFIS